MPKPIPTLNHAHVQALVDQQQEQKRLRDTADAAYKTLSGKLKAFLEERSEGRVQLVSGTLIQIVQPGPRRTIVAEKLLELNVAPEVIAAATVETPVASFVRVDLPKIPKGAEMDADTGEPVQKPVEAPVAPETVQ